jgi:pyruvate/2-oxoacid:ferredoxin oxidoreductase beta subunit
MEVENGGTWRFTVDHPGGPVEEYIRRQARFKHLTDRQVEIIQDQVDARWEILSSRVEHGT